MTLKNSLLLILNLKKKISATKVGPLEDMLINNYPNKAVLLLN